MVETPLSGYGLKPVRLRDQATLNAYFQSLTEPLSDYTFSQLYTWGNSLRIYWTEIDGQLCVFANGTGDLTLLMPPIGTGDPSRALASAYQIMDDYNAAHGVIDRGRVEYVSEELLGRFEHANLDVRPMGTDYLYDVRKMIDLPGGDLASKRQAKNRFARNYEYRVEAYDPGKHLEGCQRLLGLWKAHQDASRVADPGINAIKRQKESLAAGLSLESGAELGLKGLVVYVNDMKERNSADGGSDPADAEPPQRSDCLLTDADGFAIRGFTFGEMLGPNQSSITIEKTDLSVKGLAQFIFSEFCRSHWSDRPLVNVGDDWGLETLAWTKMSYRPVKLLQKYMLKRQAPVAVAVTAPSDDEAAQGATVRAAQAADVAAAVELEQACFSAYSLSKRQLQYLQRAPSAVFVVAEQAGKVVGEGISLVRQHKRRGRALPPTGRIYSLAVSKECRGQRIGQRMLQAMIDGLVVRGVRRIYLEVEQDNGPAISLYERFGFRSIGTLPEYYGAGRHGVHMMYEVGQPMLFAVGAEKAHLGNLGSGDASW